MNERLIAHYRIDASPGEARRRAAALAVEQSIEMPPDAVSDAFVRTEVMGRVESVEPDPTDPELSIARIALATDTVGDEPGQLMNMLFGNCSLQPDVMLIDAELPASLVGALPGPGYGIAGLRKAVGAGRRALSCTALKPQGLGPDALAALAYTFARSGIDVIKDDHGIADQPYAPFDARVPAVQRAVARANRERGGHTVYAPTISGGPARIVRQLDLVHAEGVGAVLACPMLIGIPVFAELVRARANVPVIAHPAFAGAGRIAAPLLLGRLFRLFGADATIFPNHGGRFSYDRATCDAIARYAREPLEGHPPALPVPAGGMSVDRVDELLDQYGLDTMLLIGGILLAAGDAMPERAAAFAQRVADALGQSS
ncbi:MAG: RuBisCO large subunit C-terminal-like domain-containing protein [Burkholderiaceae bacterium]